MESNKSRLLAAVLAYVFGMFGADLFYLDKKQQAIWQLALTLSTIPLYFLAVLSAIFSWLIIPLFFMFTFMALACIAAIAGFVWCIVRFVKILAGTEVDAQGNKVTNWEIK